MLQESSKNEVHSAAPSTSSPQLTVSDFSKDAAEFLQQYKAMAEVLRLSQTISQHPHMSSQLIQLVRLILDKQLSEMRSYGVQRLALLFQVRN